MADLLPLADKLRETLLEMLTLQRSDNSFDQLVDSICDEYLNSVDNVLADYGMKEDLVSVVLNARKIKNKVVASIRKVLEGNDMFALLSMNYWWNEKSSSDILSKYGRVCEITSDDNMYRMRTLSKNSPEHFAASDMFCVPFSARRVLKSYRYSVLGYPCLYTAFRVHTCWSELRQPSFNQYAVSRLHLNADNKMYLLDLRHVVAFSSIQDIESFIIMSPIIIACSLKVPNLDDEKPFKPEYIFPQILMRAITNKKIIRGNSLNGIIYTSIQENDLNVKERDCIAILVPSEQDEQKFRKSFRSTNPIDIEDTYVTLGQLTNPFPNNSITFHERQEQNLNQLPTIQL